MFRQNHTSQFSTLLPQYTESYRYGFQGQEKVDEISGSGNSYTAEYWQYDPRLGRRWNTDPVTFAWQSTYACFNNNPITTIDPKGLYGTRHKAEKMRQQALEAGYTAGDVYKIKFGRWAFQTTENELGSSCPLDWDDVTNIKRTDFSDGSPFTYGDTRDRRAYRDTYKNIHLHDNDFAAGLAGIFLGGVGFGVAAVTAPIWAPAAASYTATSTRILWAVTKVKAATGGVSALADMTGQAFVNAYNGKDVWANWNVSSTVAQFYIGNPLIAAGTGSGLQMSYASGTRNSLFGTKDFPTWAYETTVGTMFNAWGNATTKVTSPFLQKMDNIMIEKQVGGAIFEKSGAFKLQTIRSVSSGALTVDE